uniref:Uncharacterized protein n=1 Tax=Arundo donax TaxID=35708 RepID=A0A0A9H8X7_ARUDO
MLSSSELRYVPDKKNISTLACAFLFILLL